MIWFDLDNSPHVPLFRPIFKELDKRKIEYCITAREFAQTKELLDFWKVKHSLIGKHAGKNKLNKVVNLLHRGSKLRKYAKNKSINLGISHGSRTQLLATRSLGINSLLMFDYEYTESKIFNNFSNYLLAPVFIPDTRLKEAGFRLNKLIRYNGFKEELYISDFQPDLNFRKSLGISETTVLVTIRPPSLVGNYHDSRSEQLLISLIDYLRRHDDIFVLIVNRTDVEKKFLQDKIQGMDKIQFLSHPVDGLQLLYASDFVFSGGGTMNRESALLGTKTFSFFTGKKPYLDEYLRDIGRLVFIQEISEIEKIHISKSSSKEILIHSRNIVEEVTDIILKLIPKQ